MHPILAKPGRLALYQLGWGPFSALLTLLLGYAGHLSWGESAALAVPLCHVYAFLCLSSWYVCRVTPLRTTTVPRLLFTHLAAAPIPGGLYVLLAKFIARLVSIPPERLAPDLPLLYGAGVLLYLLSVAFHYVLLAMEASREAERREAEARVLAGDAELRALKAQINPHFLYNSLNSISALTSLDPARARHMCILLSDFLRSTLGMGERQSISLSEELDLVRRYLEIEKIRFGARLAVEEQVAADCGEQAVPPLLLQPLVENAVVHGIANVVENGVLRLSAARTASGGTAITIENSFDPDAPRARRNGFGQSIVRKRLATRYGSRATLHAAAQGEVYRAEIILPPEEAQPA
jgi:two-component system, LytTR family, sensor histidine kinase AlgZ